MWKYLHWKPFLLTVIKTMLKVLRNLYLNKSAIGSVK